MPFTAQPRRAGALVAALLLFAFSPGLESGAVRSAAWPGAAAPVGPPSLPPEQRSPGSREQPACDVAIAIDTPLGTAPLQGVVDVVGWAGDAAASADSGVDAVQLWVGGPPGEGTLLGEAQVGLSRPDLAEIGKNFTSAGWRYT